MVSPAILAALALNLVKQGARKSPCRVEGATDGVDDNDTFGTKAAAPLRNAPNFKCADLN